VSTNFIYSNFFSTSLAAPITSSGQTTITISSTTNAPAITAGQNWVIALNDAATETIYEVLIATARTGNVLTVLRGQEGTAATTWLAGDNVYAPDTAGILNNFALINGSSSQNFAAAAISMTGALTGPTTGVFSSYFTAPIITMPYASLFGSASTVYVANDNGATNGMMFNVPTSSTNGFQFLVDNVKIGQLSAAGLFAATAGALQSTTTALTLGTVSTGMGEGIKIFTAVGFTDIGWNSSSTTSGIASTGFGVDTGATINLMSVDITGNLGIAGTEGSKASGTAWQNLSDARIKENVKDYTKGLAGILALRPVTYDFNGKAGKIKGPAEHAGYVAQEVQAIHPEMVRLRAHVDKLNPEEDIDDLLVLDTSDVTPMLVNAVKEIAAYMAAHP
jgi:hypothetical protein